MTKPTSYLSHRVVLSIALIVLAAVATVQASPHHGVNFDLVFADGSAALPANTAKLIAPFCQSARPIGLMMLAMVNSANALVTLQREKALVNALASCGAVPTIEAFGTTAARQTADADILKVTVTAQ